MRLAGIMAFLLSLSYYLLVNENQSRCSLLLYLCLSISLPSHHSLKCISVSLLQNLFFILEEPLTLLSHFLPLLLPLVFLLLGPPSSHPSPSFISVLPPPPSPSLPPTANPTRPTEGRRYRRFLQDSASQPDRPPQRLCWRELRSSPPMLEEKLCVHSFLTGLRAAKVAQFSVKSRLITTHVFGEGKYGLHRHRNSHSHSHSTIAGWPSCCGRLAGYDFLGLAVCQQGPTVFEWLIECRRPRMGGPRSEKAGAKGGEREHHVEARAEAGVKSKE